MGTACFPEEPVADPITITVTAPSLTLTYGDAIPPLEPTYSTGQVPSTPATCETEATSSSSPGVYEVVCSGAADGYNTFVHIDGQIVIDPAPLTITASDTSSTYGQNPPAVTPIYDGLRNGETQPAVAPVCTTAATSSSPAGTYANTCSGASDPNYDITHVDGAATVSPAALTITASSTTTTYGTAANVVPIYAGLTNGDVAPATPPTCEGPAADAGVGTYPTTCAGAEDSNYDITYVDGTVTVQPKPLTITASSHAIEAGSPVPSPVVPQTTTTTSPTSTVSSSSPRPPSR